MTGRPHEAREIAPVPVPRANPVLSATCEMVSGLDRLIAIIEEMQTERDSLAAAVREAEEKRDAYALALREIIASGRRQTWSNPETTVGVLIARAEEALAPAKAGVA